MTTIFVIGGADTGRAPMAASLLQRLAEQRELPWAVRSAGVLGHDGAPAEIAAREAMAHLGLDISDHHASSISGEQAADATLLIAIDGGTARVLAAHFPAATPRIHTLGALAGRQRDIPDPFRMPLGVWISYARELEALLEAALPKIQELVRAH